MIGCVLIAHSVSGHAQTIEFSAWVGHDHSIFTPVFNAVDLNGMRINAHAFEMNMDIERATHFLSKHFSRSKPMQFVHDELPLRMMHWMDRDISYLLVYALVNDTQTKGVLSTLHLSPINHSNPALNGDPGGERAINQSRQSTAFSNLLNLIAHQKIFHIQGQHAMAGFIDLSSMNGSSISYANLFKSQAWVPIFQGPGGTVMSKNGETIVVSHHDLGNRTLTLLYTK